MSKENPSAIIVMGVSGAGKSSIGERLAVRLGCRFVEGDRLHPASNVEKMAKGMPLTDEDRWPWLDLVGQELAASVAEGKSLVLSCSSLKRIYRDRLRQAAGGHLRFVFLKGTPELLELRMGERTGHFMPLSLLHTQLATLETPEGEEGVVTVDIDATLEEIVDAAHSGLMKQGL
ncbi:MAG: gluconokinase [Alphaproteobacteria bacterium]|jgi:gluconokinase|uniref:Gluconokinase n=1 Tax=Pseudorhizobium pelagicum TaxID=1509405 RepID=A0A922TAY6_9HYPH|nr:gluconokinase [Pseudorhizobium pelagicum]MBU1314081.1 gluconokinase [Alphaproteobacteria bacterium]MDY6963597.1 gluconokinase [Pseudomonadota bacterium]KEQ09366.1 gluconokinase [Pseudorhizobium pelagicum]KEQ10814.1 gluconokinase [Pseudorhizobium pelagicum]MBU1552433.1 gluconokinase [Alphaproteobacteria bacterium]|tara:strand:+ start:4456 stop:4980 length:525 start_codon:yes stop_codon:yes gene_type:complete